ncbi:hypothetical protein M3J09_001786 [Ascochyta lentis]
MRQCTVLLHELSWVPPICAQLVANIAPCWAKTLRQLFRQQTQRVAVSRLRDLGSLTTYRLPNTMLSKTAVPCDLRCISLSVSHIFLMHVCIVIVGSTIWMISEKNLGKVRPLHAPQSSFAHGGTGPLGFS